MNAESPKWTRCPKCHKLECNVPLNGQVMSMSESIVPAYCHKCADSHNFWAKKLAELQNVSSEIKAKWNREAAAAAAPIKKNNISRWHSWLRWWSVTFNGKVKDEFIEIPMHR